MTYEHLVDKKKERDYEHVDGRPAYPTKQHLNNFKFTLPRKYIVSNMT